MIDDDSQELPRQEPPRAALSQAERDREGLLRGELQHRVRNILALVRSIFRRTIDSSGSMEDLAAHFEGRLDVLARYETSRANGSIASVDLQLMICDELENFHVGSDPRETVDGPDVALSHDVAQLVGLALHELAANSIKFGALSSSADRAALCVTWTSEAGWTTIHWVETGIPMVTAAPRKTGFGFTLIEQALPYQLGAQTAIDLQAGRLSCTLKVPVRAQASSPRFGDGL